MTISILPDHLVKMIRAGEVVVRPASVVRELVANSLDAGATEVSIETSANCRDISILDNGYGIQEKELNLALARHATSKFKGFDCIETYGFRGEALASICDMAHMRFVSRVEGESAFVTNGPDCEIMPSSFPGSHGTLVSISDLFYSHLPRLQHMRTPAHENKLCVDVVQNYAMAFPEVSFSYSKTQTNRIVKPIYYPSQSAEERFKTIFNSSEYLELSRSQFTHGDIELEGWVSFDKPGSFIRVNGRPVAGKSIERIIIEHITERLGRPVKGLSVNLIVPFDRVDVNIHPEKLDVRIKNIKEDIVFILENGFKESRVSDVTNTVELSTLAKMAVGELDKGTGILGRVVHVLSDMYAVCDDGNGMLLIDLHAGHERVLMERMRKSVAEQTIQTNIYVPLTNSEIRILDGLAHKLVPYGIKIEDADHGVYISQYPDIIGDIEGFIKNILKEGMDSLGKSISLYACHNAFRKKVITLNDADEIVRSIEACGLGNFCNHGRPVWVRIDTASIGKLFHRS